MICWNSCSVKGGRVSDSEEHRSADQEHTIPGKGGIILESEERIGGLALYIIQDSYASVLSGGDGASSAATAIVHLRYNGI